jgi:hypothetical protein
MQLIFGDWVILMPWLIMSLLVPFFFFSLWNDWKHYKWLRQQLESEGEAGSG